MTTATAPAAVSTPDNNIAATQSANASYVQANPNVFGSPSSTLPAPMGNTITSSQLQPTQPVSLPPPPPPNTSQANGLVASGQQTSKSVQDYINQLTPQPTAADQQQQQLLNQISSLTGQDTGKDQALLDAQNTSGATADQASLTALNNQLLTQTAQYNNEQANLGGNNSVETSAVLAAQNAGLTKARAADIGLTTAQIQAMQGNLTLAMNTAQQAVNAKYSTIEDNIKTSQAQLAALQPILTGEQKTQALAQQQYLDDQKQAVADQKAAETQINSVALQAAAAGASQDVIAAIQQAPDVLSAINAAAPALGAKVANDLKQQQFQDAIALRTAANDAARVGIEQENANIALAKLQQDNSTAAQSALNAVITTPSGKKYVDGTGLDAAGKAAALNAGQVVLSGPPAQAMTAINNVQGQVGALLSSLQQAGVVDKSGQFTGKGITQGFLHPWAAGSATPSVENFGTNLKSMITDLQKLPGTGSLVATLQNNVLTGKETQQQMQTKITNITSALESSENALLVNNSQPAQINLNGKTLTLQADGTYQ